MTMVFGKGMGWLPEYPDHRDYTLKHKKVKEMVLKIGVHKPLKKAAVKADVDLTEHFSPIEDQESLGSCTAHAGVGLVEYFEKRATGKHIDASRLFLCDTLL